MNFDPANAVAEIGRLWDRSHTLLWALAIGSFAGFIVLAAIALTESPTFVEANKTASPWLLLASIIFAALAALKHYQERTIQTVRLVPDEVQSYYHKAVQTDGKVNTQIVIDMQVFNISDKSIWLPNVKLLRPKSPWMALTKMVSLKEQSNPYHGQYGLPPGANTHGSVVFMIQGDLTDQIAHGGVRLCVEDQFGHKHKLNLPNLRKT